MVTGNIIRCSAEDEGEMDEEIIEENKRLIKLTKEYKKHKRIRKKERGRKRKKKKRKTCKRKGRRRKCKRKKRKQKKERKKKERKEKEETLNQNLQRNDKIAKQNTLA